MVLLKQIFRRKASDTTLINTSAQSKCTSDGGCKLGEHDLDDTGKNTTTSGIGNKLRKKFLVPSLHNVQTTSTSLRGQSAMSAHSEQTSPVPTRSDQASGKSKEPQEQHKADRNQISSVLGSMHLFAARSLTTSIRNVFRTPENRNGLGLRVVSMGRTLPYHLDSEPEGLKYFLRQSSPEPEGRRAMDLTEMPTIQHHQTIFLDEQLPRGSPSQMRDQPESIVSSNDDKTLPKVRSSRHFDQHSDLEDDSDDDMSFVQNVPTRKISFIGIGEPLMHESSRSIPRYEFDAATSMFIPHRSRRGVSPIASQAATISRTEVVLNSTHAAKTVDPELERRTTREDTTRKAVGKGHIRWEITPSRESWEDDTDADTGDDDSSFDSESSFTFPDELALFGQPVAEYFIRLRGKLEDLEEPLRAGLNSWMEDYELTYENLEEAYGTLHAVIAQYENLVEAGVRNAILDGHFHHSLSVCKQDMDEISRKLVNLRNNIYNTCLARGIEHVESLE